MSQQFTPKQLSWMRSLTLTKARRLHRQSLSRNDRRREQVAALQYAIAEEEKRLEMYQTVMIAKQSRERRHATT